VDDNPCAVTVLTGVSDVDHMALSAPLTASGILSNPIGQLTSLEQVIRFTAYRFAGR
jgi:hypothetical protein